MVHQSVQMSDETGHPYPADWRWRNDGPVPTVPPHRMELLLDRMRGRRTLEVQADPFGDEGDPAVFAALYAVQRIGRDRWLVRGVLRSRPSGLPILGRITVEHFTAPAREVTSTVMRRRRLREDQR